MSFQCFNVFSPLIWRVHNKNESFRLNFSYFIASGYISGEDYEVTEFCGGFLAIFYKQKLKQAISACEQPLCQLTVCLEFQNGNERRKGHKSCGFRSKVPS